MTDQRDLFSYPNEPGWKATDTSKAAAEGLRPTAANLRDLCLAWVTGTLGGITHCPPVPWNRSASPPSAPFTTHVRGSASSNSGMR